MGYMWSRQQRSERFVGKSRVLRLSLNREGLVNQVTRVRIDVNWVENMSRMERTSKMNWMSSPGRQSLPVRNSAVTYKALKDKKIAIKIVIRKSNISGLFFLFL